MQWVKCSSYTNCIIKSVVSSLLPVRCLLNTCFYQYIDILMNPLEGNHYANSSLVLSQSWLLNNTLVEYLRLPNGDIVPL